MTTTHQRPYRLTGQVWTAICQAILEDRPFSYISPRVTIDPRQLTLFN